MSAQIRWSDSRPQYCGHETPKRHLSPDALKDVDWVPFVKVGGTDGS